MEIGGEDVSAKLEPLVDAARSHVIPLFTALGRRRFDSAGSAVLITSSSRYYALTAGHVLDGVSPGPLFTWGTRETGAIRLKYSDALTTEPRRDRRRDDRIDLAAFPITPETADRLIATGAKFAPDTLLSDDIDELALFAFVGYPHSANKIKRIKRASEQLRPVIPNVAIFAPARPADGTTYGSVKADPRVNFVAHFDHAAERREDAHNRPMPHPRGMSGGAAYCLGRSPDLQTALAALRIVGVGTEYHMNECLFVAAKSGVIRHLIAALHRGVSVRSGLMLSRKF